MYHLMVCIIYHTVTINAMTSTGGIRPPEKGEVLIDTCVACGVIVPEGRMVCPLCERNDHIKANKGKITHKKKIKCRRRRE